jgi:hypothetical protein
MAEGFGARGGDADDPNDRGVGVTLVMNQGAHVARAGTPGHVAQIITPICGQGMSGTVQARAQIGHRERNSAEGATRDPHGGAREEARAEQSLDHA